MARRTAVSDLYDTDIVAWSEEQARALRAAGHAGANLPVDWTNVAEEIESLGISERRALASNLATIIEHLLKLETSPAIEPRASWRTAIARSRLAVEQLLSDSPSLRATVPGVIAKQTSGARKIVRLALAEHQEEPTGDLGEITYSEHQVLGDWLPNAGE